METTTYVETQAASIRIVDGFAMLIGIWLIAAPFALDYSANGGSTASSVTVGIAVLALGAWQMLGDTVRSGWASWLTAGLGAWLIAAPYTYNYVSGLAAGYNDIIFGISVAALGVIGALMSSGGGEYSQS